MGDGNQITYVISRILRGVIISGLVLLASLFTLGVIAWDADLYELRVRYERAKLALFSDYDPNGWCPPGRVAEECEELNAFEAALEAASDFTFFRSLEVEGTPHVVHTGIRYSNARDVVGGQPVRRWCYIAFSEGTISRHIELASQSAEDPPTYASLSSLDETALDGSGLTLDRLNQLARTHCRFEN